MQSAPDERAYQVAAVLGRRLKVSWWIDINGRAHCRHREEGVARCAANKRRFGTTRSNRSVSDSSEADPGSGDCPVADLQYGRRRHDGEVTSPSCELDEADAVVVLKDGDSHRRQDLVRLDRGREVPIEEVLGRYGSTADGSAHDDVCVQRPRDETPFCCWVGVGEAPADGASCPNR